MSCMIPPIAHIYVMNDSRHMLRALLQLVMNLIDWHQFCANLP